MIRHRRLVLRAEIVRTLASQDLSRAVGGLPVASDEAGICGYTQSWCESYVVCYSGAGGSCAPQICN